MVAQSKDMAKQIDSGSWLEKDREKVKNFKVIYSKKFKKKDPEIWCPPLKPDVDKQ